MDEVGVAQEINQENVFLSSENTKDHDEFQGGDEPGLPTSHEEEEKVTAPVGIEELSSYSSCAIVDGPDMSSNSCVSKGSAEKAETSEEQGIDSKPDITTGTDTLTLKSPLSKWMIKQNVHPKVLQVIYWKDVKCTAGIFGGILFLLFSLGCYPLVSVVTTFALALLFISLLYRLGMTIVNAVQKTSAEHPFKHLLDQNMEMSEEAVSSMSVNACRFINREIKCFQRLFLIESVVESLKFAVVLWLVSYVASYFSLLTILILSVVALFIFPKLYEEKQTEIDQTFTVAKSKLCNICCQLEQRFPEKLKKYLSKDKKE